MLTQRIGARGASIRLLLACLAFMAFSAGIRSDILAQEPLPEASADAYFNGDPSAGLAFSLPAGVSRQWLVTAVTGETFICLETEEAGILMQVRLPDGDVREVTTTGRGFDELPLNDDITGDMIVTVTAPADRDAAFTLLWVSSTTLDHTPVSTSDDFETAPDPTEALTPGELPEATSYQYGLGTTGRPSTLIAAGDIQTWTFNTGAGGVYVSIANCPPGMEVVVSAPDGLQTVIVTDDSWNEHSIHMVSETAGTWTLEVEGLPDASATYDLLWISEATLAAGDSGPGHSTDMWGDGSWESEDWPENGSTDPFGQPGGGFGGGLGALGADPVGLAETALAYGARVVFPFFALKSVQAITIFFVLAMMMRPSSKTAEVETLVTPEAPPAAIPAGEGIVFHERLHLDEVARKAEARRHLHRLKKANAFSFWWLLILNVVFSIATVIGFGPGITPLVQVAIVWAMFVVFLLLGRNLGPIMALLMGLPTVAFPVLVFLREGITDTQFVRGLGMWAIYFTGLSLIVLFSRRKAARFAKQDLLVLRVFGMDRAASETFSTIARAWSFLGASATIADPSYVKFQFSGMRGNLWKFFLITAATLLAVWAGTQPFVQKVMPAGLSEIQSNSILTMAAFVVLIPFVIIPVFLSVRLNFVARLDKLLARIQALLGHKRRPDGYHRRRAFFCHDDLWRPAILEMMKEAEVLLLDFRGFDAKNLGCAYEVGKVLDNKPIERAVLLVDEKTNTDVLYDIFRSCWAKIPASSPNAGRKDPELKVYIASAPVSWREGIFKWIVWFLFLGRNRQWKRDSKGVMALLSTAAAEPLPGAAPFAQSHDPAREPAGEPA